jgi:hypothetical protein
LSALVYIHLMSSYVYKYILPVFVDIHFLSLLVDIHVETGEPRPDVDSGLTRLGGGPR